LFPLFVSFLKVPCLYLSILLNMMTMIQWQDENRKSISRDAWQQLWHFMAAYPKELKDYDPNGMPAD
jgi:hypothetical protein